MNTAALRRFCAVTAVWTLLPACLSCADAGGEAPVRLTLAEAVDGYRMDVLLQPSDGGVGSAMARATGWNKAPHEVDASGLRVSADGIRGTMHIRLFPDANVPEDGSVTECELHVDVPLSGEEGTYSGVVGDTAVSGPARADRPEPFAGDAQPAQIALRLDNAIEADKEWKRVVWGFITTDDGKQSGTFSVETYRRGFVLLTADDVDLSIRDGRLTGGFRLDIPATSDGQPARTYTYRLDGSVVGDQGGGRLVRTAVGSERSEDGFFDATLHARPIRTQSHVYKRADGHELVALVDFPPDWRPTDRRPALVYFSGGGWRTGSANQIFTHARYLAERGVVVIRADYRVFGETDEPEKIMEDANSAVRWVRANAATLGVDPQRVAVGGQSAGGQVAAATTVLTGFDAPDEDHSIRSDGDALILLSSVVRIEPGWLCEDEQRSHALSPHHHLRPGLPPTLIIIGTGEGQLLEQNEEYAREARRLGNRVDFYVADGAQHSFTFFADGVPQTCHRMDLFLSSLGYLRGKPTVDMNCPPLHEHALPPAEATATQPVTAD
ncbi:MAG: alpha/beta hydrolase [Phycisphaerae bacterium]